jgi:hypothetical protein
LSTAAGASTAGMRTAILLVVLCSSPSLFAAVAVPKEHQVELRDLSWLNRNIETGKLWWGKGDGTKKFPNDLGRIEAKEIMWDHKFYPIQTFEEDKDKTVTLTFELGTLVLKWESESLRQVIFAPVGDQQATTFRILGSRWPSNEYEPSK